MSKQWVIDAVKQFSDTQAVAAREYRREVEQHRSRKYELGIASAEDNAKVCEGRAEGWAWALGILEKESGLKAREWPAKKTEPAKTKETVK